MVKISQGNNNGFSHTGQSAYAFDFSLGLGTPLVAIADGTVSHVYGGTKPGDPCYNGGGQECSNAANYVNLLHGDGTRSIYAHLSEPLVTPSVSRRPRHRRRQVRLHRLVHRPPRPRRPHRELRSPWCQSIPVAFADVPATASPRPATPSPR
jgi:hypothetical protein